MKSALYGRIVFGASAVLFGVAVLIWHDFNSWQTFGTIGGWCLAIAQIIGGIGLALPRTARLGSIVLGAVYVLLTLALIPGIIAAPAVYQSYGSFFEQFSPACGAIAVYAATGVHAPRSAALGRAARIGLGSCTVSFALEQIFYLHGTIVLVPPWLPPSQLFWAILTTVAFALAAIAILANFRARLALWLMTLMLALFGVLVWIPHLIAQPHVESNWTEFAINFLIAGAAWMVAERSPLARD